MREILFRGKTYSDKWVYGCVLKGSIDNDFYILENVGATPFVIDPETVGQFTGLTDKNGKKIFEGDIVNIIYTKDIINNCLVVYGDYEIGNDDWGLKFCTCGFVLKYKDDSGFTGLTKESTLEVIGNIHDNPELLGE